MAAARMTHHRKFKLSEVSVRRSLCLFMVCLLCCLVACGAREPVIIDGEHVVLRIDAARISDGTTLRDYMDMLVADGTLTYEMQDGMLMSLGGIPAGGGKYWMLYTDDADYAVTAWGECIYEGKTYGSASLGAETLPVKGACTYIWYLHTPTP